MADKKPLKDPKGGLTAAGRAKYNRETGSNLKAGVKGKADTPEKMRRKGSFLTRFFTNPSGPMVRPNGEPSRLALSASAWGEPVPKNRSDAAKLAEKGRRLLERYGKTKVSKYNTNHDELGRFDSSSGRRVGQMPNDEENKSVMRFGDRVIDPSIIDIKAVKSKKINGMKIIIGMMGDKQHEAYAKYTSPKNGVTYDIISDRAGDTYAYVEGSGGKLHKKVSKLEIMVNRLGQGEHEIYEAITVNSHKRQGLASAMFEVSRTLLGGKFTPNALTAQGAKWWESVSKYNTEHDEIGRFSSGGGKKASASPKSGAKNGLKDTKELTDDEVGAEWRRLTKWKDRLAEEAKTFSTKVSSNTEVDDYGQEVSVASRPYEGRKVVEARIKRNKGLTKAISARLKLLEKEAKTRKISSLSMRIKGAYHTRITGNDFVERVDEDLSKFNPNHDELGRFASGSGMGAQAKNIKPIDKLASKLLVKKNWNEVRACSSSERKIISKQFDEAPQQLTKEQLKSWDYVEKEINKQYNMLTKELGVEVEFVDYDPYSSHQKMYDSFRDTGVLKVLKTSVTGSHTYWKDETNDKFRAVHDAFGHLATGVGFDRHGEQAAYEAHKSMFKPIGYLALASELKGQNAYMVERGTFPDQRLVALPEKLQKKLQSIDKSDNDSVQSDKENLFVIGRTHHASNGRNFAQKNKSLMSILGKVHGLRAISKENPTSSDVHLDTAMGNQNKKKKKRTKKIVISEILEKKRLIDVHSYSRHS